LFKGQRVGGLAFIGGGLAVIPVSFVAWLVHNGFVPGGNKAPDDTPLYIGVGVATAAVSVGTVKLANYSRAREKEVVGAYLQGKPLPAAIRSKLARW
jgi:ABC-type Fe3+-siderophore transport system permease subunit